MAKFKDPYLKQIVDDLNLKNAATIPAPLNADHVELINLVEDTSGGGVTNTRATLRITQGDENYTVGDSMTVRYRRLDVATLANQGNGNVSFIGQEEQTKTLSDILQRVASSVADYMLPELENGGPYNLTRDNTIVYLTAKEDSKVLIGERILNVSTARFDISALRQDVTFSFFQPTDILPANADFTQEVINRIWVANIAANMIPAGMTAPDKSEVDVVFSKYDTESVYGDQTWCATLTMHADATVYTGSRKFTYARVQPQGAFNYQTPTLNTDETRMEVAVAALFAANNLYAPVLKADMGYVDSYAATRGDPVNMIFAEMNPYWNTGSMGVGFNAIFKAVSPVPYEAVFEFNCNVPGWLPAVFSQGANVQNGPTQMEVLSAPAGFTDLTIPIVNGNCATPLPIGDYKVRLTAPNARIMGVTGNSSRALQYGFSGRIRKVYKLLGVDLSAVFAYQSVNFIDPAVFVGPYAHTVYFVGSCFQNCNLTEVPAGIFDPLLRCIDYGQCFMANLNLATIPQYLFKDLRAVYNRSRTMRTIFQQTAIAAVPSHIFHNCEGVDYTYAFYQAGKITSIAADCWSGAHTPNTNWAYNTILGLVQYHNLERVFMDNPLLATLPANLFDVFKNSAYPINLDSTFSICTALTAIPARLLDYLAPWSKYAEVATFPTFEFHYLFAGCTGLTAIPSDLFQNVQLTYPGWMFQNTGITSIPSTLFANQPGLKMVNNLFTGSKITAVPYGLFASNPLLISALSTFQNCAQLTTLPAELFNNKPNLKNVGFLFAGCTTLTGVPADMFVGSPNIQKANNMFAGCGITSFPTALFTPCMASLTDISGMFFNAYLQATPADMFAGAVSLTTVSSLFTGCQQMTSVGSRIFGAGDIPNLVGLDSVFSGCTALVSVPADVFGGLTKVKGIQGMFSNAQALTSVPATIFDNFKDKLEDITQAFNGTYGLTAIPAGLFSTSVKLSSAYSAFGNSGITNPPANLFPNSTQALDCTNLFYNSQVKVIPAGLFGSRNIVNLNYAFYGCPLESIGGTILANTEANAVSMVNTFYQPGNDKNFTIADNLITSTVPLTLNGGTGPGTGPFGANAILSANINNMFGSNIRVGSKGFLASLPALTGSGLSFITKHQVDSAANKQGLFKGDLALSDYGTLPAYATTYP